MNDQTNRWTNISQLKHIISNFCSGEQVLLNAEPGPELGWGARQGCESEFLASLHTSLEYCAALRCTRLHIMAGRRQQGVSPAQAEQTFISNLRLAVPLLAAAGVTGLVEPINPW